MSRLKRFHGKYLGLDHGIGHPMAGCLGTNMFKTKGASIIASATSGYFKYGTDFSASLEPGVSSLLPGGTDLGGGRRYDQGQPKA
jgi:hypothetical protein